MGFSARIITVNGVITADQNKAIAEAAEKFGNGKVTFTSRLTVELPGIKYEDIEPFTEFIGRYGLITGGTGSPAGRRYRNRSDPASHSYWGSLPHQS